MSPVRMAPDLCFGDWTTSLPRTGHRKRGCHFWLLSIHHAWELYEQPLPGHLGAAVQFKRPIYVQRAVLNPLSPHHGRMAEETILLARTSIERDYSVDCTMRRQGMTRAARILAAIEDRPLRREVIAPFEISMTVGI